MRHEIRKSGGDKCPTCDSYELVYVPTVNRHLAQELGARFKVEAPWYRPFKRRWARQLVASVQQSVEELSELTRF